MNKLPRCLVILLALTGVHAEPSEPSTPPLVVLLDGVMTGLELAPEACPADEPAGPRGAHQFCADFPDEALAFRARWTRMLERRIDDLDLFFSAEPLGEWSVSPVALTREYVVGGIPMAVTIRRAERRLVARYPIIWRGAISARTPGVEPLVRTVHRPPDYPERARRQRLSGRATLAAVIDVAGAVVHAEVIRCEPAGVGFEEAALASVRKWRYEPPVAHGHSLSVHTIVVVDFETN